MGTEAIWIPLVMSAVSGGLSYANSTRTANRQDAQAAQGIRNQAAKQSQLDTRVNDEVTKLKGSTSDDERRQRLGDYMQTIQRSKGGLTAGLTPQVGGEAFMADAAEAARGAEQATGERAGLLARVDAAGMQRQGEGFGFGNLATDVGRVSREAQGDAFIDELRLRAIRRNPWMDMAAGMAGAAGSAYAGAGGKFSPSYTPAGQGGSAVYGSYAGGVRT